MDLEQIFLSILFKNLSCHKKVHILSKHNVTQNTASLPTECNDVLNIWQNMLHAVTGVTVVDFSRINLQQIDHVLNDQKSHIQDEFEDTKGGIRNLYWRRTDNTMAKRKSANGKKIQLMTALFIHVAYRIGSCRQQIHLMLFKADGLVEKQTVEGFIMQIFSHIDVQLLLNAN